MKGKVKFFNEAKGFGFIVDERGNDVFVHITDLNGTILNAEMNVSFDLGDSKRGSKAINVKVDNSSSYAPSYSFDSDKY
jgi:cold shock protein